MLCILPVFGLSWWGHAHQVIGRIAETYLTPLEKAKITQAIRYGGLPAQSITESATWQDDLKDKYKLSSMGIWHFADGVIKGEPFGPEVVLPNPTYNITIYLQQAMDTLNKKDTTDPWAWAFHLRSIIHFVGDVHTPNHNAALFSSQFPTGDYGANGYKLNCPFGSACMNLHFIWDAVGLRLPMMYPLVPTEINNFEKNVTNLLKEFPESDFTKNGESLTEYDPYKWSNDAYQLAVDKAYNITMNSYPTDEYFSMVQHVGGRQVVLAGRRLGIILKKLAKDCPYTAPSHGREVGVWAADAVLAIICVIFCIFGRSKATGKDYSLLN